MNKRSFLTNLATIAAAVALAPAIVFGRIIQFQIKPPYVLFMNGVTKCIYAKYSTDQIIQVTGQRGEILCDQFRWEPCNLE